MVLEGVPHLIGVLSMFRLAKGGWFPLELIVHRLLAVGWPIRSGTDSCNDWYNVQRGMIVILLPRRDADMQNKPVLRSVK